jgi:hypothetical protein
MGYHTAEKKRQYLFPKFAVLLCPPLLILCCRNRRDLFRGFIGINQTTVLESVMRGDKNTQSTVSDCLCERDVGIQEYTPVNLYSLKQTFP